MVRLSVVAHVGLVALARAGAAFDVIGTVVAFGFLADVAVFDTPELGAEVPSVRRFLTGQSNGFAKHNLFSREALATVLAISNSGRESYLRTQRQVISEGWLMRDANLSRIASRRIRELLRVRLSRVADDLNERPHVFVELLKFRKAFHHRLRDLGGVRPKVRSDLLSNPGQPNDCTLHRHINTPVQRSKSSRD